jgi:hypothetical protein
MSTMNEGFICANCETRGPHTHACQEPVKVTRLAIETIRKLKYYCKNCGRVAAVENELCMPVLLTAAGKELFLRTVIAKGTDAHACQICGQPVSPPGHICDPKELPHDCEFCGKKILTPYHVCAKIIEKAKYVCQDCGRIGVRKESLCAPARIP